MNLYDLSAELDDATVKSAIITVKTIYPNAFAERCAGGGCVIRQSLQRGIVIGHVSPGDHISAWIDAANRINNLSSINVDPEIA